MSVLQELKLHSGHGKDDEWPYRLFRDAAVEIEQAQKLLGAVASNADDHEGYEFFSDRLSPALLAMLRRYEQHLDLEWCRSLQTKRDLYGELKEGLESIRDGSTKET